MGAVSAACIGSTVEGTMASISEGGSMPAGTQAKPKGPLIYRQSIFTRAHPLGVGRRAVLPAAQRAADLQRPSGALYRPGIGLRVRQRGSAHRRGEHATTAPRGFTTIFGQKFDTTGVLGMSGGDGAAQLSSAFPAGRRSPRSATSRPGASCISSSPGCWSAALAVWLRRQPAQRPPVARRHPQAARSRARCHGTSSITCSFRFHPRPQLLAAAEGSPISACSSCCSR